MRGGAEDDVLWGGNGRDIVDGGCDDGSVLLLSTDIASLDESDFIFA